MSVEGVVNVVVTGVTGRMGSVLVRLAHEAPGFRVTGGTEKPGSAAVGLDVGVAARHVATQCSVVDSLERALDGAHVVIDFTSHDASVRHATLCAAKRVPLVIGSTGLTAESKEQLGEAAKQIAIVAAPNMSVGVNLVIEIAAQLARRLGADFDIDVVEAHHRMKKDAPSGTALKLAEAMAQSLNRPADVIRTSRVGDVGPRPREEIGVQALRGGDVVGEHTVFFFGDGERIELTHRASSRDQFGRGALRAAKWLQGRAPGLYDMSHVLKES